MADQDREDLRRLVEVVERLGEQAQWGASAMEDEHWIEAGNLVENIQARWTSESLTNARHQEEPS